VSLALSGSDRALHMPTHLTLTPESDVESRSIKRIASVTDDRAVLSEGEGKRRKDLTKFTDSSIFQAEFGAIPGSPSKSRLSLDRLGRPKSSQAKEKSEEEGRHRLSFFSTSIGRNRKPPPRYSVCVVFLFSLLQLTIGTISYRDQAGDSVKRPESIQTNNSGVASDVFSSPNLSETERSKALANVLYGDFRPPRPSTKAKEKEVSMLRKRTNSGSMSESLGATKHPTPLSASAAGPSGIAGAGGSIKLKPGAKVLDQLRQTLGEADFSGWMLKKGERYNTWKMRFFYLKGPHLYYLRSKAVGPLPFCCGSEETDANPC